jgi:hypothetical protein
MDIQFLSSSEVPLPPEEVRLQSLRVEPYADGRRVRVLLEVTPFQVRPNIEVRLVDPAGQVAESVHVIEASEPKMALTLHFRAPPVEGLYSAHATLAYPDHDPLDVAHTSFRLGAVPPEHGG